MNEDVFRAVTVREGVNSYVIVEDTFLLPDYKPEVVNFLMQDAHAEILEYDIEDKCIVLNGELNYQFVYKMEGVYKLYENLRFKSEFTHRLDIHGVSEDSKIRNECCVERLECEMVNSKKIRVKAVVKIKTLIFDINDIEIPREEDDNEICVDIQKIKMLVMADSITGSEQTSHQIDFDGTLLRSTEILLSKHTVSDSRVYYAGSDLVLEGIVKVKLLYSDDDKAVIYSKTEDVPFKISLEDDCCQQEKRFLPNIKLNIKGIEPIWNDDGEVYALDYNFDINYEVDVLAFKEENILRDAYGLKNDVVLKYSEVNSIKRIETDSLKKNVKGYIKIEDEEKVSECLEFFTNFVGCENLRKEQSQEIEGYLEVKVLFEGEENIVKSKFVQIPFKLEKTFDSSFEKLVTDYNLEVRNCTINKYSEDEYEVTAEVLVNLKYFELENKKIINSFEVIPNLQNAEKDWSVRLYFTDEGENLWDIAKRYRVLPSTIEEINEEIDFENLKLGTQVIVPQRV